MTKTFTRIFVLAFAMVTLLAAEAKADTPIGVIDLAQIAEVSSAGKDLQNKFKARKEALQKEALAYEKDLKAQEEALIKGRKTLDEKAFNEKKNAFEKDVKKKRDDVMTKSVALEKSKNAAAKTLRDKVQEISADIAKEKGIQVVIDRSTVIIAQQSLNFTDEVIKKLDETLKTVELK